jgi:hypothetical protein
MYSFFFPWLVKAQDFLQTFNNLQYMGVRFLGPFFFIVQLGLEHWLDGFMMKVFQLQIHWASNL